MPLVNELKKAGLKVLGESPRVNCKAFEDNSRVLKMACTPKLRPRAKHLDIKYHHFREAVQNGEVSILPHIGSNG
jgi:hypothetical protein